MLRIYYGNETLNKDRFIYENIEGKTCVLVPDQFTVLAERDAFFYTGKTGLMDLEIQGFSRFLERVTAEVGGSKLPMINKEGRRMLLTRILMKKKSELEIYGGYENNPGFLEKANNLISEMKQYGKTPAEVSEIAEGLSNDKILSKKLSDMAKIFAAYEEQIQGKYIDTEDKLTLAIAKLAESDYVKNTNIWVHGFDCLAPKNKELVKNLILLSPSVTVVLNIGEGRELFNLTRQLMDELKDFANDNGIAYMASEIDSSYLEARPTGISAIEANIFSERPQSSEDGAGVSFLRASDCYTEAESVAAEVLRLVREEGLRYRDIALVCNDLESRGNVSRRVFQQYGLELFLDCKRSIMNNTAVQYIISLLDIVARDYRGVDVCNLIKTGFTPLKKDEVEKLDKYIKLYGIRGKRFKEDFVKIGKKKQDSELDQQAKEQELADLNKSRAAVIDDIMEFAAEYGKQRNISGKVETLYHHLSERIGLDKKIQEMVNKYLQDGRVEAAAETAQIWNIIMGLLDQMIEILGDSIISQEDFANMFKMGFSAEEVGLIPPAQDGLMLGTMQRTRISRCKVLFVMGANEGVLPRDIDSEGILSEDEKTKLLGVDNAELCKLDDVRVQEESLAIYRNLSRPTQHLYLSYSVIDANGESTRPSSIYNELKEICPTVREEIDIVSKNDEAKLLSASGIALQHILEALRSSSSTGQISDLIKEAIIWYSCNEPERLNRVYGGLKYRNVAESIGPELAKQLYARDDKYSISPSRIELFSRCPFKHFIKYGLKPDEDESYTLKPYDLGNLIHVCMEEVSSILTEEGVEITAPSSKWMTVDVEEIEQMVLEIIEKHGNEYKEGILSEDEMGGYYRKERISALCIQAVRVMIEHVRAGEIESMQCEQNFGESVELKPIVFETENGKVVIEGVIDRVDYLPDGYVKVIDYKTGADSYDKTEAMSGCKVQLFIYLKAALSTVDGLKPAGTFYFKIKDGVIDMNEISCDNNEVFNAMISEKICEAFRMDGIVINNPNVVKNIDRDCVENPGTKSTVISAKFNKDLIPYGNFKKMLSPDDFKETLDAVMKTVEKACQRLTEGVVEIKPVKIKNKKVPCSYCDYKGICKFDLSFGCKYNIVG